MRRRSLFRKKTTIILAGLAIGLCFLGSGYASWMDYLTIDGTITSGSIHMIFDMDRPFTVQIADQNGMAIWSADEEEEIHVILDEEKKLAELSISQALLMDELAATDRYLMLQYPLTPDEKSTMQSITPYRADFTLPSQDIVYFTPTSTLLSVEGEEYLLSEDTDEFNLPLSWEVYREVSEDEYGISGILYLKLREESKEALQKNEIRIDVSKLPEGLEEYAVFLEEDTLYGPVSTFEAEIINMYSFSLPILIEQSRP